MLMEAIRDLLIYVVLPGIHAWSNERNDLDVAYISEVDYRGNERRRFLQKFKNITYVRFTAGLFRLVKLIGVSFYL